MNLVGKKLSQKSIHLKEINGEYPKAYIFTEKTSLNMTHRSSPLNSPKKVQIVVTPNLKNGKLFPFFT